MSFRALERGVTVSTGRLLCLDSFVAKMASGVGKGAGIVANVGRMKKSEGKAAARAAPRLLRCLSLPSFGFSAWRMTSTCFGVLPTAVAGLESGSRYTVSIQPYDRLSRTKKVASR